MSLRLEWLKEKENINDINLWYNKYYDYFSSAIIRHSKSIMDYGCGIGYYIVPISQNEKCEFLGVEKDLDIIDYLKAKGQKEVINLIEFEKIIKNGKPLFDLILLIDVLHNYYFSMADRALLISKLKRCLNKKGRIVTTFNHFTENEKRRICFLFSNLGFQIKKKQSLKVLHDGNLQNEMFYCFTQRKESDKNQEACPFLFSSIKKEILKAVEHSLINNESREMAYCLEKIQECYQKIYLENFYRVFIETQKFKYMFSLLREPFELNYKKTIFGSEITFIDDIQKEKNKNVGDLFFWEDSVLEIVISSKDKNKIRVHYLNFK